MNIWEPLVGECLKSRKEPTKVMDKTVVAVIRINSYSEEVVVGHVPKNMSKIVFMFISLPHCALDIFVTGKRKCKTLSEIKYRETSYKNFFRLSFLDVSATGRSLLGGNANRDLKTMSATEKCTL